MWARNTLPEIHYIYNLQPLVMNLKIFEKLGDEDRKILLKLVGIFQELSCNIRKK